MTHPRNDPRNRPESRYHTYFDPLCALCDAPLPYPNWGTDSAGMFRLGWMRDRDGAWVCPREHSTVDATVDGERIDPAKPGTK